LSTMAIDTSRLRKRLPEPPPPTEGAAGIERLPDLPPAVEPPTAVAGEPVGPRNLDGRALRSTGRIHQLNVKVTAETKGAILRLASERKLLVAEVIEEAIRLLEDDRG
jgi:hypothetical protein